ncbi:recombinase family protein [Streptomyces sp. NPDC101194]|uniref:recombinase family protein n=1 Tax=Streptomyces sp. NPDC101194 TaxID=3366127 RepID=UPI00380F8B67
MVGARTNTAGCTRSTHKQLNNRRPYPQADPVTCETGLSVGKRPSMLIGYCRTSTADQNPDHQIDALLRHGVDRDNIHVDVASGAEASRAKLDLVMQLLREGDTLKVTRLDRLSRSVLHLVTLGADLRERGIGLHVIEQGIDTSTMEGRAMFGMLSVLTSAVQGVVHGQEQGSLRHSVARSATLRAARGVWTTRITHFGLADRS